MRTIYFKKAKKEGYQSLKEMLQHFHSIAATTYWSDNNACQCYRNRNRSIDDLILLANHYFPGSTAKDVLVAFKELSDENKNEYYQFFVCGDIKKPVLNKYMSYKYNLAHFVSSNYILYKDHMKRQCENSEYTLSSMNELLNSE